MATPESSPQLLIRPARDDDAPSIREIFNEAVQDGLTTFATVPRTLDEQRRLLAAAAQNLRCPIVVAELRGWTAGWITIQPIDGRPQFEDFGEVNVFVRRSFRKYGIGRQLMRSIQEQARSLGYRKLIGYVLAQNTDSLRLCRSTGWREVGRHLEHARRDAALHDVVLVEYLVS